MANIGKVLKDEMIRLSRKHALAAAKPLKSEIRNLKRQLRNLQKTLKTVQSQAAKKRIELPEEAGAPEEKIRAISGKGIKSLRRRLKITQAELGKLANVSTQAVVLWERRSGKLRLRSATSQSLNAVRAMSKAEVKAALGK